MRTGRSRQNPINEQSGQNRSESVRQRRNNRTQQRIKSTAARVVSSTNSQRPVIMRGVLSNTAEPFYRQAAKTNPRRQFYVSMDNARATGVAGAELRLPAIPMIRLGWRLISGLLVLSLLIALISAWNSPFFRVSDIHIFGLERLSASDLEAVVRLSNLSIIEVQPEKIKEEITLAFPELADVQVKVELPNYVSVTARERQPLLAWQKGETTHWIDAEGFIFPMRGEAGPLVSIQTDDEIPLAPVLNGTSGAKQAVDQANQKTEPESTLKQSVPAYLDRRADMKILNATLQLTKKLPEGTQLVFDKQNGLGWKDPGGWQVYIGKDLDNFEVKLETYQAIIRELENQGIRPVLVSVAPHNAPFYRADQTRGASDEDN